jgi:hypothetical protein
VDDETRAQSLRAAQERRKPPLVTCGASRHVHIMADVLASGKPYPMFVEEPETCAASLYAVVAALWEARHRIKELETGDADV